MRSPQSDNNESNDIDNDSNDSDQYDEDEEGRLVIEEPSCVTTDSQNNNSYNSLQKDNRNLVYVAQSL